MDSKNYRHTLAVSFCALATLASIGPNLRAAEAAPRPNVILIMLDDLGWADLGCYGSTYHKSPNIDRLSKQGMRFTQAYAAAPVCSPTRAALMTGRCPARLHLTNWIGCRTQNDRLQEPRTEAVLPLAEVTVAEHLQAAGYVTANIGKWHLGGDARGPRHQGFRINIGGDEKGTPRTYFAPFTRKGADVPHLEWAPPGSYLTDVLNDAAIQFIREHREQPFFLNLSHFAVHTPLHAKPHMVAKHGQGAMIPGRQSNPVYAAMIESVDDGIGKIVRELEKLKLSENTILIFTSDNGGVATVDWPFTPPTVNGPLREGKGYLYEGGIRVPLIVRWPRNVKAGTTCQTPVTTMDFLPTILEICEVDKNAIHQETFVSQKSAKGNATTLASQPAFVAAKAPGPVLDGVSLMPLLRQTGNLDRDALYWHYPHYSPQHGRPCGAIRAGDYKLIEFFEDGRHELFNLNSDPGESNNLVEQEPDRVRDLEHRLAFWRKSVGARLLEANPPYVPNPQNFDGIVSLHARAATVHGSMLRFQSPPHLDKLSYWGKQQDWVSFEFALDTPGKFDLELLYSCRKEDAGSELEISLNGQRLTHTVRETKEKKFEPRNIATLELSRAGNYSLSIKPQSKPGQMVMELRRVRLVPTKQ